MDEACSDENCPSQTEVYAGMALDPVFRGIIARAREAQQHATIDDTIRMADEATEDNWQVVRLRIWARQWRAAKLAPKVYGDRVDVNHGGGIGIVHAPYNPALLTQEQREVMRDALLTIDGTAEPQGEE